MGVNTPRAPGAYHMLSSPAPMEGHPQESNCSTYIAGTTERQQRQQKVEVKKKKKQQKVEEKEE